MIYELRTYHIPDGRMEDILDRFRTVTMRLFKKYNMDVVGFWTGDQPETDHALIYLMRYPDEEAMEKSWASFRADTEWIATRERTEADGPIVNSVESKQLVATDFSPM